MRLKGLVAIFLVMMLSGMVSAKVWRVVGELHGRINVNGLPWTKAYQTRMNVNGKCSDLVMYTARYTEPVVDQIKLQLEMQGAKVQVRGSAEGVVGLARWPDCEAKFLVVSAPSQPTHFIFFTYPDPSFLQTKPKLKVPEYINGVLRNIVEDEDTRTVFASFDTNDPGSQIHLFYGKALRAKGWELVVPAVFQNGQASGVSVYQKNNDLCYVQVSERKGASNLISLLVKGGEL